MAQLVLHLMYYKSTKEQMEARKRKAETGLSEVVVYGDQPNKIASAPAQNGAHRPQT